MDADHRPNPVATAERTEPSMSNAANTSRETRKGITPVVIACRLWYVRFSLDFFIKPFIDILTNFGLPLPCTISVVHAKYDATQLDPNATIVSEEITSASMMQCPNEGDQISVRVRVKGDVKRGHQMILRPLIRNVVELFPIPQLTYKKLSNTESKRTWLTLSVYQHPLVIQTGLPIFISRRPPFIHLRICTGRLLLRSIS